QTYTHVLVQAREEKGSQFQLVVFTSEGSSGDSVIEQPFQKRFTTAGMKLRTLPLSLKNAQLEDTGTYYCASQDHTAKQMLRKPSQNLFTGTPPHPRREGKPVPAGGFTSEGSSGDSVIEQPFQKRFTTTGMKLHTLPLSLKNAQLEDTGTYYCASQDHTAKQMLRKPSQNLFTGNSPPAPIRESFSCYILKFKINDSHVPTAVIDQTPDVIIMEGDNTTLRCSQVQTSHTYMSWYKQEKRREAHSQFQLVVFTSEGSSGVSVIEQPFQKRFTTTGMKLRTLPLSLKNAQLEDTGTYYCASQDHTAKQMLRKPSQNLFTGTPPTPCGRSFPITDT
ncbi:hypothetical protein E2320_017011, partial [Naja naja]